MRMILALPFLIAGHFLILIAGFIHTGALNWHLDMLVTDIEVMKLSGRQS